MNGHVVIVGGGLAGCLAARALQRRGDLEVTIVESQPTIGGNHTWSFFDTDVAAEHRWLVDDLVDFHWPDHEVRFPGRRRTLAIGYNSISSSSLDRAMRADFPASRLRLGTAVRHLEPTKVVLEDGELLEAQAVIDARGATPADGIALGYQKFVGHEFVFARPHGVARPIIMDATVRQQDGYRFVYFLPLTEDRLLVEDTYYSTDPHLDGDALDQRVIEAPDSLGRGSFVCERRESGVLPVVMDGRFESLWPDDEAVARLGVRGGFFHPTTSYSLPDAVQTAVALAQRGIGDPGSLAQWTRERGRSLWADRAFYRLLNRMLFRAARPGEEFRIFERFYGLPLGLIARFYAGHLRAFDKVRLLAGRPPVPLLAAIRAIKGRM